MCLLYRRRDPGADDQHVGANHDDVIKWKHFPRYWPFVWGIHQWRRALIFSLICVWKNGWENNRGAGDLRRYRSHYDVIVMITEGYEVYNIHCRDITCFRHLQIFITNRPKSLSRDQLTAFRRLQTNIWRNRFFNNAFLPFESITVVGGF